MFHTRTRLARDARLPRHAPRVDRHVNYNSAATDLTRFPFFLNITIAAKLPRRRNPRAKRLRVAKVLKKLLKSKRKPRDARTKH